jgi:Transposase
VHVPGIAVNRAADAYRGEGKTDAKDAAIIADQTRMRRDLRVLWGSRSRPEPVNCNDRRSMLQA